MSPVRRPRLEENLLRWGQIKEMSFGGACDEHVEEFAERVSHGTAAVCALSLSARAGGVRAESVSCVPDGRLPYV